MWSLAEYLRFEEQLKSLSTLSNADYTGIVCNENWLKQLSIYTNLIPTFHGKNLNKTVTKYFVTFTKNPKAEHSVVEWKAAVHKQLDRVWYDECIAVFEHPDSNIHCHALITPRPGQRCHVDNYKMFREKYGHVDVRAVHKDNGITEYMSKENKIFIKRSTSDKEQ